MDSQPFEHVALADREDWLEYRRKGLGSSDAAALVGATNWQSPFTIWNEKVGLTEPQTDVPIRFRRGHALEPLVAELYTEETGEELIDPGDYTIQKHRFNPWMMATVDRFAEDRIVELKTADAFYDHDWDRGIPLAYEVQVQHQMLVTGYQQADVAVLIGSDEFRRYTRPRHARLQEMLSKREYAFWHNHVVKEIPPEPGSTEADKALLRKLYPEHTEGKTIVLPSEAMNLDEQLQAAKQMRKEVDAQITQYENQLKEWLKDAEAGMLPDGSGRYSWKATERKGYTVAPTTVRTLRRHKK